MTSPPYWNIKDYGYEDQIGYGQSYQDYLRDLMAVWRACDAALEPGCKFVINVGDQFLRSNDETAYQVVSIHSDIIRQFREMGGYTFLGNIIWHKVTNTKSSGGGSWMGSTYYPRDGYVTYEHEYILIFRKDGKARRPTGDALEKSRLTMAERSLWFRGTWDIPPERQYEHIAPFPVELPERIIRMFTFWGEMVLEPFCGSGSTLHAAFNSGRNCIGYDLNPEYVRLALRRVPGCSCEEDLPPSPDAEEYLPFYGWK